MGDGAGGDGFARLVAAFPEEWRAHLGALRLALLARDRLRIGGTRVGLRLAADALVALRYAAWAGPSGDELRSTDRTALEGFYPKSRRFRRCGRVPAGLVGRPAPSEPRPGRFPRRPGCSAATHTSGSPTSSPRDRATRQSAS